MKVGNGSQKKNRVFLIRYIYAMTVICNVLSWLHNRKVVSTSVEKASALNTYFTSCFNQSFPPLILEDCWIYILWTVSLSYIYLVLGRKWLRCCLIWITSKASGIDSIFGTVWRAFLIYSLPGQTSTYVWVVYWCLCQSGHPFTVLGTILGLSLDGTDIQCPSSLDIPH